ncbi:MAG: response regulator [Phycisphaerae bacterium]|jgi:CheY-like chemotaxis protein
MTEQTGLRKLLVLRGPALEAQGIVGLFHEYFEVQVVNDLDEALAAMRQVRFDAVLAETGDFLPLERGAVTHQASAVLDTIGDGVCITAPGGELAWANRRLREFPPEVLEQLGSLCSKAYEEFAAQPGSGAMGKRFSLMPPGGSYYEVICSPVRDRHGQLRQVAAVVVNATSQRRQQLKLNAIDRAGRELVRLDDDTSRRDATARLRVLEDRILRCSREVLDYKHFAVHLLDARTNSLELLISQGLPEEAKKYQLFARVDGNGIIGHVAATGRSYVCGDVQKDPHYLQGLINARSSLTVPLRLHDKVIGVLNVESDKGGAFGEEDRQFAEIFANYLAVALHMLNLLVYERYTAHSQFTDSISAEMTGPLNDILTDATSLMEDYIGMDDLRIRLGSLIDAATQARACLHQLAAGSPVVGAPPKSQDPILAGKKVLVADDEALIRETIRDVLVQQGCRVEAVADGVQACQMLASGDFDLVISDIKMPGASGYEVFAAAKAARGDCKVILITAFGYDPGHSIVRAHKEGLDAVVMKPFKVRQLLDECRTALTGK